MMSDFSKNNEVYLKCLMTWHTEILLLNECRMDKLKQRDPHEPPNLDAQSNECKPAVTRGVVKGIKLSNTHKNILSIHHLNCRSYVKKQEEVFQYINEHHPDILFITETWMDKSIPKGSHEPPGYILIRKDRSEEFKEKYSKTGMGGGIALLYKKNLNIEIIDSSLKNVEEILWVHLKGRKSFRLGVVYNTEYCKMMDDKSGESLFETQLRENVTKNCETIILGDFNINLFNLKQEKVKNKKKAKKLTSIFKTYKLKQIVKEPTRVDSSTGKESLLDHIWTNAEFDTTGVLPGLSDHKSTFINIKTTKPEPVIKKIKIRNYKNYNQEDFLKTLNENLTKSNLMETIQNKKPNEATNILSQIIRCSLDKHAPIIEIQIKDKKSYIPWYTEELKNKIKERKELLADSRCHGKFFYKKRLKSQTNEINFLKFILKKEFVSNGIENADKDIKAIWKILNLILGNDNKKQETLPDNVTQEKVNEYNKFFATVGHEVQKKN